MLASRSHELGRGRSAPEAQRFRQALCRRRPFLHDSAREAAAPGPIPRVLMDELALAQTNKAARHGEPIVLLTHSMGGQIAYDVLTSFLPAANSAIKVDFRCAGAS